MMVINKITLSEKQREALIIYKVAYIQCSAKDITSCQCLADDQVVDVVADNLGNATYSITGCCGSCYVVHDATHCFRCGKKITVSRSKSVVVDSKLSEEQCATMMARFNKTN